MFDKAILIRHRTVMTWRILMTLRLMFLLVFLVSPVLADDENFLKQQLFESQQQAAKYKQELVDIRSAIQGVIGDRKTVNTSHLKAILDPFTSTLNPDCRLSGKVIKVADGDSTTVLDQRRGSIRLGLLELMLLIEDNPTVKQQRSFYPKLSLKSKSVFSGIRKISMVV